MKSTVSNFWGTFKSDLRRSLFSSRFLVASAGVLLVCLISVADEKELILSAQGSVYYELSLVLSKSGLAQLLYMLGAACYVNSFCADWNHQYIRPMVARCGVRNYGVSKTITCALVSVLVVMTGLLLFCLLLHFKLPFASESDLRYISATSAYGPLLLGGFPFGYFLSVSFTVGLFSGCCSVMGLAVSGFMPNKYVAVCAPFFLSRFILQLTNRAPSLINVKCMINDVSVTEAGVVLNLLYVTFFMMTGMCLFGYIFTNTVKRRLGCEIT